MVMFWISEALCHRGGFDHKSNRVPEHNRYRWFIGILVFNLPISDLFTEAKPRIRDERYIAADKLIEVFAVLVMKMREMRSALSDCFASSYQLCLRY